MRRNAPHCVFWLSIRTRIKTKPDTTGQKAILLYFDYPLEQGLRHQQTLLLFRGEEYFDYPLEQGLRRMVFASSGCGSKVFWLSIRTRIKTQEISERLRSVCTYFDYPLEQGLRLRRWTSAQPMHEYFDYPLEQGLRHDISWWDMWIIVCILIIH